MRLNREQKRQQAVIDLINQMFIIAGHQVTYDDIKDRKDAWYADWEMTVQQAEEWKKWGIAYLRKNLKVNKKIAGILVESEIQGSSFNSIIGIGINLYNSKSTFPATSYGTLYETELEIGNKEKILQLLIENINITFQRLYVGEIKEEI